jgi:hypothetical protein
LFLWGRRRQRKGKHQHMREKNDVVSIPSEALR